MEARVLVEYKGYEVLKVKYIIIAREFILAVAPYEILGFMNKPIWSSDSRLYMLIILQASIQYSNLERFNCKANEVLNCNV